MTVYVAEISGRGIVAFDAATEDDARALLSDQALRRDLHVFQHKGRCLWDGVSEINLREALPKEAETWHAGSAAGHPDDTGVEGDWRVFLLPVVDPTMFDNDDHDDDNDDRDDGD